MDDAIPAAKNAAHYIQDRSATTLGKRRNSAGGQRAPVGYNPTLIPVEHGNERE